ncbi:MAG TPA: hypothetical protein VMB50_22475 [Myxococcales bacterium]|nr:hypothetical protein [Myxococcales bacterium]
MPPTVLLLPLVLAAAMPPNPLRFANPIARFELLRTPDGAAAAAVQREFLAGNWALFDTWAALAQASRLPRAGAPSAPHAMAFTALLRLPAADRQAVLRFLRRARALEAGVLDPLARHALPEASSATRRWLLQYLAAFEAPLPAPPTELLGPDLLRRPNYPDEATVAIAGDLGLLEAVPHLLRFVGAPRRFYQLYTDYSTSPQEVGHLFSTSLFALTKLASEDPSIERSLAALEGRVSGPPASRLDAAAPLRDPITFETFTSERTGSSHAVEARDAAGSTELGKAPLLDFALRVVRGKAHLLPGAAALRRLFPEATWVRQLDLSSLFEGRGGPYQVQGGRLIYLAGNTVGAVDLGSGDLVFQQDLSGVSVEFRGEQLSVDPNGAIVLEAAVAGGDPARRALLLTLDPEAAEVVAASPIAQGHDFGELGPVLALAGDGVALSERSRGWVLGRDGKVRFRHASDRLAALTPVGGAFAFLAEGALQLVSPEGRLLLSTTLAKIAGRDGPFDDRLLPAGEALLFFAGSREHFAAGASGKLLWTLTAPEPWTEPPRSFKDGYAFATFTRLSVYGFDGKAKAQVDLHAGVQDFWVDGDTAIAIAGGELLAVDLTTGAKRRLVAQPIPAMAHLVGTADGSVILLVYLSQNEASGYHLLRVPYRFGPRAP